MTIPNGISQTQANAAGFLTPQKTSSLMAATTNQTALFAMWSQNPTEDNFIECQNRYSRVLIRHLVSFDNPFQGRQSHELGLCLCEEDNPSLRSKWFQLK